jgi:miniconductance mechanosensitive channel
MIKTIESIFSWCNYLLLKIGFNPSIASYVSVLVNSILLCALAYSIYIIFRIVLVTAMIFIARKTKTKFDDLLVSNKTAKYIAHLIPLLFVYKSVPIILNEFVYWESVFG